MMEVLGSHTGRIFYSDGEIMWIYNAIKYEDIFLAWWGFLLLYYHCNYELAVVYFSWMVNLILYIEIIRFDTYLFVLMW